MVRKNINQKMRGKPPVAPAPLPPKPALTREQELALAAKVEASLGKINVAAPAPVSNTK